MNNIDVQMFLPLNELLELVKKQLQNNFILRKNEYEVIDECIIASLEKCKYNFRGNRNKYYYNNGNLVFNPFNTVQYSIFLYYMSSLLYEEYDNEDLASRVYFLNKLFTGTDLFYAIKLPNIFGMQHPVGAVMGRAVYSDYFYFYQNMTVGGNKNKYPKIEKNVILFANATVLGNSHIGSNCLISANTYVKDETIPSNAIIYGSSPNLIIKRNKDFCEKIINEYFIYEE